MDEDTSVLVLLLALAALLYVLVWQVEGPPGRMAAPASGAGLVRLEPPHPAKRVG